MTALSGGLVYEYSQEESDYGLVVINRNGSVSLKGDFDNLQSQYNKLNISLLESTAASNTQTTPPPCSKDLITTSGFSTQFNIPTQPDGASDLINNGIKSPNQGKLVSVGDLNVKQQVFSSSGKLITGLAVKQVANANTPSGQNTSGGGTGTGSGNAKPSTTKKAAAGARVSDFSFSARWTALVGGAVAIGAGLLWSW